MALNSSFLFAVRHLHHTTLASRTVNVEGFDHSMCHGHVLVPPRIELLSLGMRHAATSNFRL